MQAGRRFAPFSALAVASAVTLGAVTLGAGAPGCGGSSGGGSQSDEVTVAVTDAAVDQVAIFDVGLTAITLQKASGGTVSVLPASTRLDLADLVDVSDVVSTQQLPAGIYTSMAVTFDFTGATCLLSTPTATGPATLLDASGQPLTGAVTETIDFGATPLVVPNPVAQMVTLDFNLDGSLTIDEAANVVTVNATILADVDAVGRKPFRVPGILKDVSVAGSAFTVDVRPRTVLGSHGIRRLEVSTGANATVFVLDNAVSVGAAGLTALEAFDAAQPDARVLVAGVFAGGAIQARVVLAGSTLPQATKDLLHGVVTARAVDTPSAGTDTVTVRGAFVSRASGGVVVTRSASVQIPTATLAVYTEGATTSGTAALVDVGSTMVFFGDYAAATATMSNVAVARRKPSSLVGTVTGVTGNTTTISLVRVGPFPAALFTPGGSWSAAAFTIDTTGFVAPSGTPPIRAVGFFAGFPSGAAPDYRLERAVVDRSQTESAFGAGWSRAVASTPEFINVGGTNAGQISLNLTTAPPVNCLNAVYDQGLVTKLQRTGTAAYVLTPRAGAAVPGFFSITTVATGGAKMTRTYRSFSAFSGDLSALVAGTTPYRHAGLVAAGRESSATAFTADVIVVVLRQ